MPADTLQIVDVERLRRTDIGKLKLRITFERQGKRVIKTVLLSFGTRPEYSLRKSAREADRDIAVMLNPSISIADLVANRGELPLVDLVRWFPEIHNGVK